MFQTSYKDEAIELIKWGEYNPLASTVLISTRDFFWADGSTGIPSDTRSEDWSCPFSDKDVKLSHVGIGITSAICYSILIMAIITSLFIWRKFWQLNVIPLSKRVEFSQSDLVLVLGMIIEFFQYITTGPNFSQYALLLHLIGNILAADLEEILDLKDGLFWSVVNIGISLTGLMMIFSLFKISKLEDRFPKDYSV